MNELLAAGGTGQEVAAAVMRLAYLAGIEAPRVTVFDSDIAPRPAGSRARTRSQVLDDIQKRLVAVGAWPEARLTTLNPAAVGDTVKAVHVVRDVYASHGALSPHDSDLLDLLLDDTQQHVTVTDGFHGHPAVGSLVFANALEQPEFQEFMARMRGSTDSAAGTRVVLAASVAGGTGTAVVPMLVQRLAELRRQVQMPEKLRLLALLQLPWFRLEPVEGEEAADKPDVGEAQFDRNATCLMRGYLKATLSQDLDALLLLGLPRTAVRASNGGHQQLETRHYLCVLAGLLALDLLDEQATERLLGEQWRGTHALQLGEGATAYEGTPNGPVLARGDQSFTLRRLVYAASGLRALTEALTAEARLERSTQAQHTSVRRALRKLPYGVERETFLRTLGTLHELHVDIHDWLRGCLTAQVGAKRADDETVRFLVPEGGDAFFATDIGTVLRRHGAALPFPPIGRRLLQRLLHGAPSGENGKQAAWALVNHARERLLQAA